MLKVVGCRVVVMSAFVLMASFRGVAQDQSESSRPQNSNPFPVGISLYDQCQFPDASVDVMGFRFCFGYGRHANVSGLDIGVIGCGVDGSFFGAQLSVVLNDICVANGALQLSGVANNCNSDFGGFQISGIANSVGGVMCGGQCACFNVSKEVCGTQIGLFNKADKTVGIQIGVINWTREMQGIQLGVINVIEKSPYPYMPLFNAYF